MSERTLLERLRNPRAEVDRRASDDLEAMAESILRHLQRMLNSRQGHSLTVPAYGIPDLSEIVRNFPESTGTMEEAIKRSIELYEPRLRDVTVRFVQSEEDLLTLSFEITAQLVTQDEAGVWFMTRITPDGRVEVRG